jgi:cysteinyl-tRNA synthetase
MIAGARVEIAPYKREPMDFILWKPSKPGEPAWPSPAGIAAPGRPGWHIECSAMSWKYLGEMFDIHGGGIDLVFPHHENEIAQSRCAFHTPVMANYWMHNGFLQVEGEKMSKSLGNFVTIHELLATKEFGEKDWSGSTIRLAMLKTHYRQPLDWTVQRLWDAEDQIVQWSFVIDDIVEPLNTPELRQGSGGPDPEVVEALCDDLNTHMAIAAVSRLAKETRSNPGKLSALISSLNLMGLSPERPANLGIENEERRDLIEKIGSLVEARNTARKAKDFKESDRIRDELAKMGVVLHDTKDGTTWEIAR